MKKNNCFFTLLLIIFLFLTGCKSSKDGIGSINQIKKENLLPIELTPEEILVHDMHSINPLFNSYCAKISGKYDGFSFGGQLRIEKDKIIWISLSFIGIEGARLKLTPDSIFFINKLSSEAFKGNYNNIERIIGIKADFNIIQSILLGNDIQNLEIKDFTIAKNNNNSLISFTNRKKINSNTPYLNQQISYNKEQQRIEKNFLELIPSRYKIDITYKEFIDLQNIKLPSIYSIKMITNITNSIEIKTDKQQLKIEQEYPFNIPSNYQIIK